MQKIMEYSKSYNEVTLQISAWKKNYESRTFDFYEKKVTTYMQSRSCNKMNIYCHSNHTLKQDSATTSSSEKQPPRNKLLMLHH